LKFYLDKYKVRFDEVTIVLKSKSRYYHTRFAAITTDVVRQQLVPIPPIAEQMKLIESVERGFLHLKEIAENIN
jgi:hypothetical protein